MITKLTCEVEETLAGTEPAEKVGRLRVIVERLQTKLSVLHKLDNEILALCDVKDIEHEIEESEGVSAKIFDYKRRIEAFLNPTSPIHVTVANPPPPIAMATSRPRLPKLELPKFRGNVTNLVVLLGLFQGRHARQP